MSLETTKIPRVALVEGDPVFGMEAVKGLKRDLIADGMLPDNWVEMCPPTRKPQVSEFLNALDGEVSTPDWDGKRKGILLRGLVDNKQFMDALLTVIRGICSTNTLIVFDETRIMCSGKGNTWGTFRDACRKFGSITSVPIPFDELNGDRWWDNSKQVRAIVDEVTKRGKKILPQTVRDIFLEKALPEWSFILPEIDKLIDLVDGDTITPQEVDAIVFPTIPNHKIYEFSKAFNKGKYDETVDVYDDLIASGIDTEVIIAYAMKLVRWQLITAHLISYGQPLPDALQALAKRMNREDGRKRMERDMVVHPRWFIKETEEKKEKIKKFDGITPAAARDAVDFVKDVFTKRVPVKQGALGTLPFNNVAMNRYKTMFECMLKVRVCGEDKQLARETFRQALRKVCW